MKESKIKFETGEFVPTWASDYSENKFAVYSTCFLSTRKNSHELKISEEVLRENAPSILGSFLVAKLEKGDATGHLDDEIIYGYFPREQEIIFQEEEENGEKIVKACAYCVISKMYGNEFNDIFHLLNNRNTSVEMTVWTSAEDEHKVEKFDIFGLTCLGKRVKGSCPDASMQMVRFDEQEAEEFFKQEEANNLHKFEEKYEDHPINTSKEALYEGEWDGDKAKHDLIKEKDYETLAPKVCLRLEEGWKDREVTKLGYPVMGLHEGEWVYFRKALSSALSYAKQENEEEIVNKIEKIYKDLDLKEEGKGGDVEMNEIEFSAVDIGNLWSSVWDALYTKYAAEEDRLQYSVESLFEEDNQKFAILKSETDNKLYRLDFSFTAENGVVLAEELVEVTIEVVETENVKKFAEPEDVEKYRFAKEEIKEEVKAEEQEEELSEEIEEQEEKLEEPTEELESLKTQLENLQKDIEDKDHIIMEQEQELSELREFKRTCMESEKASKVEALMEEVAQFMDVETVKSYREEGLAVEFSEIDVWANKVKATVFDKKLKKAEKQAEFSRISFNSNIEEQKEGSMTALERLQKKYQ